MNLQISYPVEWELIMIIGFLSAAVTLVLRGINIMTISSMRPASAVGLSQRKTPWKSFAGAAVMGFFCYVVWSNAVGFDITKMNLLSYMTIVACFIVMILSVAIATVGFMIEYEGEPMAASSRVGLSGYSMISSFLIVMAMMGMAIVLLINSPWL